MVRKGAGTAPQTPATLPPPHLHNAGGQGLKVLYAHIACQNGGQLGYLVGRAVVGPLEEHDAGLEEAALFA